MAERLEPGIQPPEDAWRQVLIMQISESWNDIRQFDAILWQIPTAIGAIAGIMLAALTQPITEMRIGWIHAPISIGGVLITFPLVVALFKTGCSR